MRLYYMTCHLTVPKILAQRKLKLSRFEEMNDVFELVGAAVPADKRKLLRRIYDYWSSSIGALCMTESWQNPVMWAHYTAKHQGVCLGFDVAEGMFDQVKYHRRKIPDVIDRGRSYGENIKAIEALLTTKYKDWSYEREWRHLRRLSEEPQTDTTHMHFVNFGPDLMLREVILGARSKLTVQEAALQVDAIDHSVKLFKVRAMFGEFKMVKDRHTPQVITPTTSKSPIITYTS